MKTKSIVLIAGVIAGGGLLFWAFTRDTVTSGGGVHVPAPTDTGKGKSWIADIITAGGGAASGILDSISSGWKSDDDQKVAEEAALGTSKDVAGSFGMFGF